MTDHDWAEEHVAAHVAGALTPKEAKRLEAHARDCPGCAAALAETRALDRRLSDLFAGERPGPDLEDQAVERVRVEPAVARKPAPGRKLLVAAAAVVALGACGALIQNIDLSGNRETFAFVGSSVKPTTTPDERAYRSAPRAPAAGPTGGGGPDKDLTNEDPGIVSEIPTSGPNRRGYTGSVQAEETKNRLGQPDGPNTDVTAISPPPFGMPAPALGPSPPKPDAGAVPGGVPAPPPADGFFQPGSGRPAVPTPVVPAGGEGPMMPMGGMGQPKPEPAAPAPQPKDAPPKVDLPKIDPPANPEPVRRIILRSGEIEFEVPSFDAASAAVTKLVTGIKGAFISNAGSDKLPNGKVKGSITVRCPPEFLDGLVLDLRKEIGATGELKGVKLVSQDVTKQFTDTESKLRAARAMEGRLIQMIKEGKGEIKQLLEAERELGVWRTKIEEYEGEIRYFSNLASLSTLTITLTEKEIRAAAALTESERVQAGVEVEDVDKAYQEFTKAVADAKGRILKSEVRQLSAGQFNASLHFEVAPEASGILRDRLRQLGRVARLEIDRVTQVVGGTLPTDAKTKRGDTVFLVQIYNLAAVAPREITTLQLAVQDVPAAYQALRDAAAKVTSAGAGRVLAAALNEQDKRNVTAQFDFEVRRADEGAFQAALAVAGEVISRQVNRSAESDNVTDAKVLYRATLLSTVPPRETAVLTVAAADVPAAYQALRDAAAKTAGRVLTATLDEKDRKNVSAQFDYEVRRTDEAAFRAALDAAGEVLARQVSRLPEGGVTDAKVLYRATLVTANRLRPRQTTSLTVEVADVDGSAALFAEKVREAGGRPVDAKSKRDLGGKATADLVFEVPLAAADGLVAQFKAAGVVRAHNSSRDPQAPDGRLAVARLEVSLNSPDAIVAEGDGLWPQVRKGLSYSASVLLRSVTWVVFGLCVVLPWALVGYGGYWAVSRAVRTAPLAAAAEPAPAAPAAPLTPPPPAG
ncbi:MAG: hypothetical protein C0501_10075 [Isosphaera sp.]|nr:hypothetical protein [Isosphaera sp.]